MVNGMSYNW